MKILITGGAGYIGSHTAVELLDAGYEIVIVDNFSNSKKDVIDKIKTITGKDFKYYELDVCDKEALSKVFTENKIDSVIHFVGFKAVGESVKNPLKYYDNNLISAIKLLEVMNEFNCKNIVFSSSAVVYGIQDSPRYIETMSRNETANPYGTTKATIEKIMEDLYYSDSNWTMTFLRYFNPVGSHESGLIGDNLDGYPNNLMPYILKVATGSLPQLTIFGNDYDTPDGTCIRDYIHIVDLAKGHLNAIKHSFENPKKIYTYNLGSGKGISVKEMVDAFEKVNNLKLNYRYGDRREGDLPEFFADPSKALHELNWKTEKTVEDMCRDAYNFALKNNM